MAYGGSGSTSLTASGSWNGAQRVVTVSAYVSGTTLSYTIDTSSPNGQYPHTRVGLYVNGVLIYDSGYQSYPTFPAGKGSTSGSTSVPSTGNVSIRLAVGISHNNLTDVIQDGTISRTTYYTVKFVNGLGSTLKTQDVASGSYATPPANPTRTGYTFAGWSGSYTNVTSDRTVTATWVINTYTVAFVDGFGNTLKSETVNYGGHATPPSDPTKGGYTFLGWDGVYTSVTSTRTITATWEEHILTVNYYSNYATESFSGALNTVGADRNVLVRQTTHSYSENQPNGLYDYSEENSSTYLGRIHYKGTEFWGTELTGGYLVHELTSFASGQALAEALGVSLIDGSISIDIYPQWEIQANCFQKQEGKFLLGMMYKRINGEYKTGLVKLRKNGSYTDSSM